MPHHLPPGQSFRIVAASDRQGELEVVWDDLRVVVYAWSGATIRVYRNDQLVDDFGIVAPELPPGTSTQSLIRSMFGGSSEPE